MSQTDFSPSPGKRYSKDNILLEDQARSDEQPYFQTQSTGKINIFEDLEYLPKCTVIHPAPSSVLAKGFKLKTAVIRNRDDVALPLFAYCPQIERFEFFRTANFRSERPERFPISTPPLVSFKNLTVIKSLESIDWSYFCRLAESAGVKAFPALKHLKYCLINEEDITLGINPIFEHMESLEELEIQALKHGWNLDITPLNLKRCFSRSAQTLKNITIKWKVALEGGEDLLKKIRMALEDISHTNVLQRLDLHCDIPVDYRNELDFQQWNHLDLLLTADEGAAFPLLNEVRISLRFMTVWYESVEAAERQRLRKYENILELAMSSVYGSSDIHTSLEIHTD
ncbi:hypothetical protein CVT24_003018 [Panaeolus cyanescens]|uniref:F-box domain-containing protein n=1 Tax=Panaeolus cyanescens TaxID=181874 RepID=A0A409VFU6_9AGAR|nr:hypothetical protein CVT24_003018 [Panaeolus cyanescens]